MAAMFITPKRMETIDFTQPYAIDPTSFAVAKSSELGKQGLSKDKVKLDDEAASKAAVDKLKPLLKGKVIGVQSGTQILAFLKKYFADVVDIRNTRRRNSMTSIWPQAALTASSFSRQRQRQRSPSRNLPTTRLPAPALSAASWAWARVQASARKTPH